MPSLSTLRPELVPWAEYLLYVGKYNDRKLVVTSAYRSRYDQAVLFDRWKRGESAIPAARPGSSAHEFGRAFDLARLGIDPFSDPLLAWLGQVWTGWGGRYGGRVDPVHFSI